MSNDLINEARQKVEAELENLLDKEFGWDGSEGLPMRFDAYCFTEAVFKGLYGFARLDDLIQRCPVPEVMLNPNGTVSVEFGDEGQKQLFLTFQCDNVISYLKVIEDDQTTVEGVIRFDFSSSWEPYFSNLYEEQIDALADELRWLTQE